MAIRVPGQSAIIAVPMLGPQGPPGPPGTGGFAHQQLTPAATWTVEHTLGRRPYSVTVTVDDEIVLPDICTPDDNTVVVTFAVPVRGRLDLV